LDHLVMKDYHDLNKYNLDLKEYSTLTGFDERTLYAKYSKRLAVHSRGRRLPDSITASRLYC